MDREAFRQTRVNTNSEKIKLSLHLQISHHFKIKIAKKLLSNMYNFQAADFDKFVSNKSFNELHTVKSINFD